MLRKNPEYYRTLALAKANMMTRHLKERGITQFKVLEAMQMVPRECFVSLAYRTQAYADHPLPTQEGQTISQPYVVAWMAQLLNLQPDDTWEIDHTHGTPRSSTKTNSDYQRIKY